MPPAGSFESFFCGYLWSGFVGYAATRIRAGDSCPDGFVQYKGQTAVFCVRYIFPTNTADMTSHLRDIYPICRHGPNGTLLLGYGYLPPADPLPLLAHGVDGTSHWLRTGRMCAAGYNMHTKLCVRYTEELAQQGARSLEAIVAGAAVNNTVHYLVGSHRYEDQVLASYHHHAHALGMSNFVVVATDVPLYVFLLSHGVENALYFPPPKPVEWCMTGMFLPQWRHTNYVKLGFALEVAKLGYNLVMFDGDIRFQAPPTWHPAKYDVAYSAHQPPLSLECLFLRGSQRTVALLRDAYMHTLNFAWDQEVLAYLILTGGPHAKGLRKSVLGPPHQRLVMRPGGPNEAPSTAMDAVPDIYGGLSGRSF